MDGYYFKSSKFEIEPGEDEDINPRIYGRQLAVWLKAKPGDGPPPKEDVTWLCFVTAEMSFLKNLFRRRKVDSAPAVAKLYADVGRILRSEPQIQLVDEP